MSYDDDFTSGGDKNTCYIKELNLEMIAPSTKQLREPENFGGSKTLVIGKPGCFTRGTPILMYDGQIKNVEDVQTGDIVMGDDSTPRNVMELCHNYDEMFKIIPTRGDPYTVNKQHKLVLKSSGKGEIVEITIENYLQEASDFKENMKIFRSSIQRKTCLYQDNEAMFSLANKLEDLYPDSKDIVTVFNKENRLHFLAGILDNNFTYKDNSIQFDCQDKQKLDYVIFLARSIGYCVTTFENYCLIYGNLSEIPLRTSKINFKDPEDDPLLSKFEIEPQGEGEYFGFTLDGNHRFLLGSCDVVRNTGKSTIIASLLYAKKHIFPVAIAFSGSEDSNGFYRKILPSTFVFNEYNEEQIKSFIRRQKIAKQHLPNPWAVILLDDCTDDPRVFNTPLQQGMFKRGRHWSMWYIISLQYAMDVKPVIRTNTDGVFILREPILKNRKTLWENYASVIPDFSIFCQLMDQLTDDFCCMYVSNQSRSNNWQDCVFWYKAPIIPEDFKFGSPEYRQFHDERFNPAYIDSYDM